MGRSSVILYSRPGCHLCDEAREVIDSVCARHPFDLDEVNIDGSDALTRDYGVRIPVVVVDGVEVFEYRVDASELEARLRSV